MVCALVLALPSVALRLSAQTVATVVTGYTVTGRVLCADTQRPARFAQVSLIPASDDNEGGRGRRLSTRTDLDGAFTLSGVPQGAYYVTGQLTGYVNEASTVQAALSAGGDPGTALAGVPLVRVGAGGASTALSLQRGGVIAGTVQWDDGSPAAGVQVSAQAAPTAALQGTSATQAAPVGGPGGFGGQPNFPGAGSQTDDRGRFRLTGLLPGTYVVRANVQAPAPQQAGNDRGFARLLNLSVYAPDKLRRTDAATITLTAGEERDDIAVTMGLAGLHAVSGSVSAPGATVRSGSVSLTDQTDSSLNRSGLINPDGSFTVPYVPPGNYTLRVNASSQAPTGFGRGGQGQGNSAGPTFQPLQESVTVADGDLSGLTLSVTPSTTTAAQ